jgi:hypothetical protein
MLRSNETTSLLGVRAPCTGLVLLWAAATGMSQTVRADVPATVVYKKRNEYPF